MAGEAWRVTPAAVKIPPVQPVRRILGLAFDWFAESAVGSLLVTHPRFQANRIAEEAARVVALMPASVSVSPVESAIERPAAPLVA